MKPSAAPSSRSTPKGTGIKVAGEWLNVSNYHPVAEMPTPGELVECTIERSDRGQWINSLKILGANPAPVLSTPRDAEIRRQVAIKTAAQLVGAFAHRGALLRISNRLYEQRQVQKSEGLVTALVVRTDQENAAYIDQHFGELRKGRPRRAGYHAGAYERGKDRGGDVSLAPKSRLKGGDASA